MDDRDFTVNAYCTKQAKQKIKRLESIFGCMTQEEQGIIESLAAYPKGINYKFSQVEIIDSIFERYIHGK